MTTNRHADSQSFLFLFLLRTPDLGYDFNSNSGRAFNYFSYGVACSEVEVDCLTGAHQVREAGGVTWTWGGAAGFLTKNTKTVFHLSETQNL